MQKFRKVLRKANLKEFINENELVAIKLHVGERENLAYINHNYARVLVEEIKAAGGKPFLTDTNTLYSGGRHNGVDHAVTAVQHGFTTASVGIRSVDYIPVKINGKHIKEAKLAPGVLRADKVIFLTHIKGHIGCGQCVAACNYEAATPKWDEENQVYLEKVTEYAYAVATELKGKPNCDHHQRWWLLL